MENVKLPVKVSLNYYVNIVLSKIVNSLRKTSYLSLDSNKTKKSLLFAYHYTSLRMYKDCKCTSIY